MTNEELFILYLKSNDPIEKENIKWYLWEVM
jgi:hypothetical protein